MLPFLCKRAVTAVFVFLGATFITYAMMMVAPGDAPLEVAVARYGEEIRADRETIDWIRKKEGLDRPFLFQYGQWLRHIVALDFGHSLVEETPVWPLIKKRFLRTVELAVWAIVAALSISLPLGVLAGIKRRTWIDSMGVAVSVLGVSMPNYWFGLLLILWFSVKLQWLPSFGRGDWHHLILPALTLGTALTACTTRILRTAIIEAMQAEFLIALRARGVGKTSALAIHIIKNALIPVVTVVGIEFGMILEGAVMTETVFAWPGLGDLMVSAVSNRDYPLIQGLVLFTAGIFVLINFVVDIVCLYLDPRIRLQ
ncbi:MAG: ABC transporter permease [Desulfosarcina sp.]|nr:ABC transporter permease [Desulfobacterales bacterium]